MVEARGSGDKVLRERELWKFWVDLWGVGREKA